MIRKHTGHVGQQVAPVKRLHLDLDHEHALRAGPFDFDHAFRLAILQINHVLAVGAMHGNALVARDESDDLIPRHRHAATGELDPHVAHALDGHAAGARALDAAFDRLERQHLLLDLLVDFVGSRILDQVGDDVLRGDLTVADGRE